MSGLKRASVMLALALGLVGMPAGAWAGGGHGHGHGHHGGHGHSSVVIGVGPWWGWGGPWYYGPRYYYPYPAYYPAYPAYPSPVYQQRVVVEEPPVYIERDAAPAASADYWYYCESSGAYYPDVESCAEPWVKVPPRAQ